MVSFSQKILELLSSIPVGRVATYSAIAAAAGHPGASRAAGNVLNANPQPVKIPCHRVILSSGRPGGYVHGTDKKIDLLRKEGVMFVNGRVEQKFLFKFDK